MALNILACKSLVGAPTVQIVHQIEHQQPHPRLLQPHHRPLSKRRGEYIVLPRRSALGTLRNYLHEKKKSHAVGLFYLNDLFQ